jgi:hypothetical protein
VPELNYLSPESNQTLREAIWELRQAEGTEGDAAEKVSPELLTDIEVHDAIHVVFACPTTLAGEILAHTWTVFGTTLAIKEMHRVNRHTDHQTVLAEIGHGRLLRTWLKSFPQIVSVVWRALRMRHRWPAEQFEQCLDQTLYEIRSQYGIRLYRLPGKQSSKRGAVLRTLYSTRLH